MVIHYFYTYSTFFVKLQMARLYNVPMLVTHKSHTEHCSTVQGRWNLGDRGQSTPPPQCVELKLWESFYVHAITRLKLKVLNVFLCLKPQILTRILSE